jgi:hypothetical protein
MVRVYVGVEEQLIAQQTRCVDKCILLGNSTAAQSLLLHSCTPQGKREITDNDVPGLGGDNSNGVALSCLAAVIVVSPPGLNI